MFFAPIPIIFLYFTIKKNKETKLFHSWGVQKFGSLANITETVENQISFFTAFNKKTFTGTGKDETIDFYTKKIEDHEQLTNIEKSFRQIKLLHLLQNNTTGIQYKYLSIQQPENYNLLPSLFFKSSIKPNNIHSGGLLDDWLN